MEIEATRLMLPVEEALQKAKQYYLARVISRHRPQKAELHYFPYYGFKADFMLQKNGLFRKGESRGPLNMDVIVSGTGGKVSMGDFRPETEKIVIQAEQLVDRMLSEVAAAEKAERELRNVVYRRLRGRLELENFSQYLFYRPHWIVFFGEKVEGSRLYYIPIPADAYEAYRTT